MACNEYQFDSIKLLADKYFSTDEYLLTLFSTETITTIYLLQLNKMQKNLKTMIKNKVLNIDLLKFDTMACETLNFFRFDKKIYLEASYKW